jgi:hypothetical protein
MTLEDRARQAAEAASRSPHGITWWEAWDSASPEEGSFALGYLAARVEVIEALERMVPEVCWHCANGLAHTDPLSTDEHDSPWERHDDDENPVICDAAPLYREIARLKEKP